MEADEGRTAVEADEGLPPPSTPSRIFSEQQHGAPVLKRDDAASEKRLRRDAPETDPVATLPGSTVSAQLPSDDEISAESRLLCVC